MADHTQPTHRPPLRGRPLLGGIEAGGTKFLCAVGLSPDRILRERRIPTTTPDETLREAMAFFADAVRDLGPLSGLGVASFGPVGVRPDRPGWGRILATPKPGWSQTDLAGTLTAALGCPVAIDTDVNGAALGEHRFGAGGGVGNLVYVTVGTGLGGGVLVEGRPIHGMLHPEIGHLPPRRHKDDVHFPGCCPFHGDCLEGLASGTAIAARCGAALDALRPDHPIWDIEADYLAQLCAALVLSVSPERIVMGGGVMQQERLFPLIRARLAHWLGGYPDIVARDSAAHDFITPPGLGGQSGIVGALCLAEGLSGVSMTTP
jgi:fructokinase